MCPEQDGDQATAAAQQQQDAAAAAGILPAEHWVQAARVSRHGGPTAFPNLVPEMIDGVLGGC